MMDLSDRDDAQEITAIFVGVVTHAAVSSRDPKLELPPSQLVTYAFAVADLIVAELRKRQVMEETGL